MLYIIRHGKTDWNEKQIPSANPVSPPVLNEFEPTAMNEFSIRCETNGMGMCLQRYLLFRQSSC